MHMPFKMLDAALLGTTNFQLLPELRVLTHILHLFFSSLSELAIRAQRSRRSVAMNIDNREATIEEKCFNFSLVKKILFSSFFYPQKKQSLLSLFISYSPSHCWPPSPIFSEAENKRGETSRGRCSFQEQPAGCPPCRSSTPCCLERQESGRHWAGQTPRGLKRAGITDLWSLLRDPCPSGMWVAGMERGWGAVQQQPLSWILLHWALPRLCTTRACIPSNLWWQIFVIALGER